MIYVGSNRHHMILLQLLFWAMYAIYIITIYVVLNSDHVRSYEMYFNLNHFMLWYIYYYI